MRPLIGITIDCNEDQTKYSSYPQYAAAVERAGGLPLLIPYRLDAKLIPDLVDRLDGILFSGGDDLDSSAYGETPHPKCQPIDPARERFERALMAEAERRKRPTLGICLGSQLMNVHRGGTLTQFLPDLSRESAVEHRKLGNWNRRHRAKLVPDTALATRLGAGEIEVNTSHKQAVKHLGRGLRIIATSPDGVIEGVEDPALPLWLGVQWHPERMPDEPQQQAIFQMLVEKARRTP